MFVQTLSDLDELLLTVRNKACQEYVKEAILAHRNGLNRAAVISLWVSVAFDIISKLRELSNQEEPSAVAVINELDSAVLNSNVRKLQEIESSLLERAHKEFEFISEHEKSDLERLKSDRDACAHPAFISQELLLSPTPEIVRAHIVHAIIHLLRHPPVQGKAALLRLKTDIQQTSFPKDQKHVNAYISERYLNHAKSALVSSMTVVLLKQLIRKQEDDLVGHERTICRILVAIAETHPNVYEDQVREKLPGILSNIEDTNFASVFLLLAEDRRVWQWLDNASQIRAKQMVKLIDSDWEYEFTLSTTVSPEGPAIADLLDVPELRETVMGVFNSLDERRKETIISGNPRPEFANEAIQIYSRCGGYRAAERIGASMIIPIAPHLNEWQVLDVLAAIEKNSQIRGAAGSPQIVQRFFEETKHIFDATKDAWQRLMHFLADGKDPDEHYAYPGLRAKLEAEGIWPVETAPDSNDEFPDTPDEHCPF